MPATVNERPESPRFVGGASGASAERLYIVSGETDPIQARLAVLDEAPVSFDPFGGGVFLLLRDSIAIEPINLTAAGATDVWHAVVTYTTKQPAQARYAFETGGGQQQITQSRATTRYAKPGTTAPDFKGAIGVTENGVEGVSIAVPIYNFSETHTFSDAAVSLAYRLTLFNLTGKVNAGQFKGFQPGEVLFLGAAADQAGLGDVAITFSFAAAPNVTGLVVGDITGISKRGWEYLWIRYEDTEDANAKALVKTPTAVYVEQVYAYGDFALLGIDTAR